MMNPKRRTDEPNDLYFPRLQDNINEILYKNGWLQWDLRAKDFYFKWAGSVSRMTLFDKARLAPKALLSTQSGTLPKGIKETKDMDVTCTFGDGNLTYTTLASTPT